MNLTTLKKLDLALGHALIFLLRPLAMVLGQLLRPGHSLAETSHLVVLKMLGGGSLIIAAPALIALRGRFPAARMTLICTPGVKAYAELLHVFDDFAVVDTRSLGGVLLSSVAAIRTTWRASCLIDLEVHSKLSTVFSLLTCAVNRVGFYMEQNRWQLGLGTHFLFLHVGSLIATSYEQMARMFGAEVNIDDAVAWFREHNEARWERPAAPGPVVALAPYCSELGKERELTPGEWVEVLGRRGDEPAATFVLLGDGSRAADAAALAGALGDGVAGCAVVNLVARTSLAEVTGVLRAVDELVTIDSGVNHLGRLLGRRVTSYWGPTDPATRLREIPGLEEEVHYEPIFCSPCVHYIDTPPCRGDNICIKQFAGGVDVSRYEAAGWAIDREAPLL